jgi:Chromo (CHRromatin Organisation MOdifier) domain
MTWRSTGPRTNSFQSNLRTHRQAPTQLHTQNVYQLDDLILWNPKEHKQSFRTSKLTPKLLGPYTVLNQVKNNITCQHVITKKIHLFHAGRVTPFIGTTQDADKVGLLDREEFEVNSILQYKGNLKLVSTLTFLVLWEGYTSESDTWEPWTELKHLLPLHTYLRNIGHSNLIPSTPKYRIFCFRKTRQTFCTWKEGGVTVYAV